MESKIGIIGIGNVSKILAFAVLTNQLCKEIVLASHREPLAVGEAMDLEEVTYFGEKINIKACGIEEVKNCNIIVVISSIQMKKNLAKREELLRRNAAIYRTFIPSLAKNNPDAIFVIVSNPVDELTYYTLLLSQFPANKIIGTGTMIDSIRVSNIISRHIHIKSSDIKAYVIGDHGPTCFLSTSLSHIAGIPLLKIMEKYHLDLNDLMDEVKNMGWNIFYKRGFTAYGISLIIVEIIRCIIFDSNKIYTVSTLINNYYGVNNVCLSMPCVINKTGISEIFMPKLTKNEIKNMQISYERIKCILNSFIPGRHG